MRKWPWFLLSAFVLLLDQWSKYWVNHHFYLGERFIVTPFLNITRSYNTGAAFGFLNHAGVWHHLVLAGLSIAASVLLIIYLWRSSGRLIPLGLSLLLGGAVGNLIDRVLDGRVTDFIDFHVNAWHFATFNLADSAISIGAMCLLLIGFISARREK